jgi:nucleotidyltransferase substrate binding protein (TIGR01987 family)
MHQIDTTYLKTCNEALKKAYILLKQSDEDSLEYEIYRSAVIKEFEIILEQSGKLLKKRLRVYFSSNKEADKLTFKDIFRHAGLHSLLSIDEVQRWLKYRDSRNQTSHEYGSNIADEVLEFIEYFIQDSLHLIEVIDDFKAD